MELSLEERSAAWGRTLLVDSVAALELLWERSPKALATVSLQEQIIGLRYLVGASNADTFVIGALKCAESLGDETALRANWPSMAARFFEAVTQLQAGEELDDFMDAYADSIVLAAINHPLTTAEISLGRTSLLNLESFSLEMLKAIDEYPDQESIERNLYMPIDQVKESVIELSITMQKLRLLCLILEVDNTLSISLARSGENLVIRPLVENPDEVVGP